MKRQLLLMLPLLAVTALGACSPVGVVAESSHSEDSSTASSQGEPSTPITQPDIITSEDDGTATVRIFRNEDSTLDECYIAPRNVSVELTYQTLSGTLSNNQSVCPSIGDVNLLVIPVHLPGVTGYDPEEVREDIQQAFFGEDEKGLGFPSLKEYYLESSYGKLNFSGEVTDWFDVAEHTDIKNPDEITNVGSDPHSIQKILRSAVDWAISDQGIDISKYDSNGDDFIDGVWLVYDKLDTYTENDLEGTSDYNTIFWNMTTWDYESYKTQEEKEMQARWTKATSAFSWGSVSSLYIGYAERYEKNGRQVPDLSDLSAIPLDTHTLIHETGHLLGLEDYYASDSAIYRPAGQFTMMDQNVGDLDSYSKMVLGWVTPYVAYGPSSILLQKPEVNDHQVIVIPSNYSEINKTVQRQLRNGVASEDVKIEFNPFSEYIMIDMYSPAGLNSIDAEGPFLYSKTPGPKEAGVRIYHIDSRIFKCRVLNIDEYTQELTFDPRDYVWDGSRLDDDQAVFMPITNSVGVGNIDVNYYLTPATGIDYNALDQIRLIQAGGRDTFSNGVPMSEVDLFTPDTQSFSIADFGMQFFNGNYGFNGGENLPFTAEVSTLKE